MTGEEQVYALFVQANPIPDPDALLLTLEAPAPLLYPVEERKGIMLTEERSRVEEPQQKKRGLRSLAAVAAAFVVVLALGAGVWWLASDDGGPVAAEEADPVVTFDGEVVGYAGPQRIVEGLADFTLVNELDELAVLATWRFPTREALDAELARVPGGTDLALEPDSPAPLGGIQQLSLSVPAGEEATAVSLLSPAWYLVDVVTAANGVPNHAWRADVIVEVVSEP